MIAHGHADRVVVAAGYLVEPDQFGLFDAGRALATDGQVRPFSARRTGLLLGDGVAAVVLESASAARGRPVHAWLAGWGRTGDAYHVCRPDPTGAGMARAIGVALRRAGISADEVGYLNAHGSGTPHSDVAEAAAIGRVFGVHPVPVSSTKSVVGQALEAAGLLEFIVTALALGRGELPVNAGYLGPDEQCPLDVVTGQPRRTGTRYAMSVNAAFGGANTALVVGAP
jgi:3-oxoacyl-(acyl-carrier-protein) synthase